MPRRLAPPSGLPELIDAQHGVLSRAQLLDLGLTKNFVAAQLAAHRWRRVRPGVYLTFTGPAPFHVHVWAALLYAGEGAVATGETAAFLGGLRDLAPTHIEISVEARRRVLEHQGGGDVPPLRIRRVRDLQRRRHPSRSPAQTRIEDTVLDLIDQAADPDRVVSVITGSCQRRLTTATRLAGAAARRARLRWRGLLAEVLDDVLDGAQSPLERRWRRDVERAHGLPTGQRNHREGSRGSYCYRDVRYRRYRTVVELDGNAAHPAENRELDRARDNHVVEAGEVTLRYGWRAVAGAPCLAASQVGRVLASRGWQGHLRPCGSACPVIVEDSAA